MQSGQPFRRFVGTRRWLAAALGTAAVVVVLAGTWGAPAVAKPGVVTDLQGKPYGGDVTEDDKFVYISAPGGQIRLDKRNVAKVDYAADVDNQYKRRHDKLAGNDVKGRMALADWANGLARPDLAVAALEEARQIEPANREVALQLDAVQRQMDLDRRRGKAFAAVRGAAKPTPSAAKPVSATTGPTTGPASMPAMARRLLTADEVNIIRQKEMRGGDRQVKVRLEHNVARRFLQGTGDDPKAFARMSGEAQALTILGRGSPDMAKDVRILTDPTPLRIFKNRVLPIVALGCASTACHGGTRAGDFSLYPGNSTEAVYTNFYILQTYAAQIGGVKYLAMDREVPERSLVLQYGLPPLAGKPPHPAVKDWRPRFHGMDDPAFMTVDDWLTDTLSVIQPDYGFNVSAKLPPSTQPATMPAVGANPSGGANPMMPPTTRPEPVHGTPLPRTRSGAVTQPSP